MLCGKLDVQELVGELRVAESGAREHQPMTLPSLDGMRAVSIMLVLVGHAGFGGVVPGGLGVTIFIFLSGYLITTLMLNEHAATKRINIPYFFARRVFRLMPALAITLTLAYGLVVVGVLSGEATVTGYFAQLFYFANYYQIFFHGKVPPGTGILWSLAVEEHYYIIFPFLVTLLLLRTNVKVMLLFFLSVCIGILCWRMVLVFGYSASENRTYYATDTRIDSIIFGCVFALARFFPEVGSILRQITRRGFGFGIALILFTLLYRSHGFRETIRYSLQGIALMPIFGHVLDAKTSLAFRLLNTWAMSSIGRYSYFIYLVHFVVMDTLRQHVSALEQNRILLLVVGFVTAIIYSMILDVFVDVHFKKLRARYH